MPINRAESEFIMMINANQPICASFSNPSAIEAVCLKCKSKYNDRFESCSTAFKSNRQAAKFSNNETKTKTAKKKTPKTVNFLNHKSGCQVDFIDQMLCLSGTDKKDVAETLNTKESRLYAHVRHLRSEHGIDVKQDRNVTPTLYYIDDVELIRACQDYVDNNPKFDLMNRQV